MFICYSDLKNFSSRVIEFNKEKKRKWSQKINKQVVKWIWSASVWSFFFWRSQSVNSNWWIRLDSNTCFSSYPNKNRLPRITKSSGNPIPDTAIRYACLGLFR